MTNLISVKLTRGMARPLEVACVARIASGEADAEPEWSTLKHFLYWCQYLIRTKKPGFVLQFTKADNGSLGFDHALVLYRMLLRIKDQTNGHVRAAICRRIAKIEDGLEMDPVTRLGAVSGEAGRTAP